MEVEDIHWTIIEPTLPFTAEVRIRYRHRDQMAAIQKLESGNLLITFKKKQRALTPGQSAVFYIDGEVIGGGVIV
jgi:tRNA-specific 2-thiouridylase